MKVVIGRNPARLGEVVPDLQKQFPDVEWISEPDLVKVPGLMADADVEVGRLTPEIFEAGKQLKWVQATSTGVDAYLEVPGFSESDVILTNLRGTHGGTLADHIFAMMLAFGRNIIDIVNNQPTHTWRGERNIRASMRELNRTTMGIVGYGNVGRAVASRAAGFGMDVIAIDMFPPEPPDFVRAIWGLEKLDDLMRQSDYVAVTVPYTPQSANMVGAEQIGLMKPDAMLVGISRGGIIDEPALAEALRAGRIRCAAMDTFVEEPLPPDHYLWDVPNLLISPHAAGGSQYERDYIVDIVTENLRKFIRGEFPLRNQIDKKLGF